MNTTKNNVAGIIHFNLSSLIASNLNMYAGVVLFGKCAVIVREPTNLNHVYYAVIDKKIGEARYTLE